MKALNLNGTTYVHSSYLAYWLFRNSLWHMFVAKKNRGKCIGMDHT